MSKEEGIQLQFVLQMAEMVLNMLAIVIISPEIEGLLQRRMFPIAGIRFPQHLLLQMAFMKI